MSPIRVYADCSRSRKRQMVDVVLPLGKTKKTQGEVRWILLYTSREWTNFNSDVVSKICERT